MVEKWQVEGEELAYADRWVRVVRAHVRLPNGRAYVYTTLWRVPGAAIVALNDDGNILLVREYRHPLGQVIDQLPGGLVDEGETPLMAAQRELREETGLEAHEWEWLGEVEDNPGLIAGTTTLFLARDLHYVADPAREWTEFLETHWEPPSRLQARIACGEIRDRVVLAAWAFLTARGLLSVE